MDRLKDKLAQAAGVNARVAAAIEADADALIAREDEIMARKEAAFEPHHAALEQRLRELDRFEDSLKVLENASPLPAGGDTDTSQVDKLLENAVAGALTEPDPSHQPGSGASTEPGT
jgi:hypothetical protein